MSCGRDNLAQCFLHIVIVMLKVFLAWHIHCILFRVIMCDTAAVRTYGYQIVTHFQKKVIEANMHGSIISFSLTSLLCCAIICQQFFVFFLIGKWHCGLVNAKQCAYLSIVYTFI